MDASLTDDLASAPERATDIARTAALDAARVVRLLSAQAQQCVVESVAMTSSTNADLRSRINRLDAPVLRVAASQTAGRGRAGRRWVDAAGDSLSFSLAWPCAGPLLRLSGLPLAVGVAIASVLRARGWPVMLKWPNDLLLDGQKLGGILVETASACERVWAIIGVGLNVHANAVRDAAIGGESASLAKRGIDREALLASLADALTDTLARFDREGLAPFVADWDALHAHAGQRVMIVEQGEVRAQGIARGIDARGCLLIDTGVATETIAAGDVSLRMPSATAAEHGDAAAD